MAAAGGGGGGGGVFLSPRSLPWLPRFSSNRHLKPQNSIFSPKDFSFPKASLQLSEDGNIEQPKKEGKEKPSDRKRPISPTQEDFLALFRRIEFSISKGAESRSRKSRNSKLSEGKAMAESLLDALDGTKKDLQEDSSTIEAKKTRPPSNFIKKSPIPSSKGRNGVNDSKEVAATSEKELPELEKLKVAELKEIAKVKGLRGYSKMKKSELVQLLQSN